MESGCLDSRPLCLPVAHPRLPQNAPWSGNWYGIGAWTLSVFACRWNILGCPRILPTKTAYWDRAFWEGISQESEFGLLLHPPPSWFLLNRILCILCPYTWTCWFISHMGQQYQESENLHYTSFLLESQSWCGLGNEDNKMLSSGTFSLWTGLRLFWYFPPLHWKTPIL